MDIDSVWGTGKIRAGPDDGFKMGLTSSCENDELIQIGDDSSRFPDGFRKIFRIAVSPQILFFPFILGIGIMTGDDDDIRLNPFDQWFDRLWHIFFRQMGPMYL